ncbi:hypothetical protein FOVG_05501 [Fusarium oxysporum f. sp. pisi HDV247]|uniref:Uncharacterized protein n=1 Tax=Fusarium oxysporum f. sp. pisi HDV247 TaxID=1080344 RepID=W9PFN0_FUSOX|nr:hypothetical protein FOVG_05501 [Fusarium oxysporum f. sp. pisi HDV247]
MAAKAVGLFAISNSWGGDEDLVNFTRRSYMLWDRLVL